MHPIHSKILECVPKAEEVKDISAIGTIVYSSIQPGPRDIYTFKNGIREVLVSNHSLNYNASFHPEGEWMVYTSEINSTPALYALNLKTSDSRCLMNSEAMQDSAAFSPDGKAIYFISNKEGKADIFVASFSPNKTSEMAEAVNLTKKIEGGCFNPSISPDGNWIAFTSNGHLKAPFPPGPILPDHFAAGNIYMMKSDGSNIQQISFNDDWDGAPTWSLDGEKVYFYSMQKSKPRLHFFEKNDLVVKPVFVMEAIEAISPLFSSDGRLWFVEKQEKRTIISSIDLNTGLKRHESDSDRDYFAPTFHPQGWYAVDGDSHHTYESFGGMTPPNMKKPMGKGPFLISERDVILEATNQKIHILVVRGYFPAMIPKSDEMLAYEEFSKIYSVKAPEWKPKVLFTVPENLSGMGLNISPDGKWAVTSLGRVFDVKMPKHIYKISLESNQCMDLMPESKENDTFPTFMPNGGIVFSRAMPEGNKNLFVMDGDGHNITQLTFTKGVDSMPNVHPKGNKIVFASKRNHEPYNLYMLKRDKKMGDIWHESQLTNSLFSSAHPKFSPDGKKIVFSFGGEGLRDETPLLPKFNPQPHGDIVVMDLKSKKITKISQNKWEDSLADWAP